MARPDLLTAEGLREMGDVLPGDRPAVAEPFVVDEEWKLLTTLPRTHAEGADVEVWVIRLPARFYRVRADEIGLRLTTGSGQAALAADLANALAGALLGVEE